jgi:HD-GYP domain-containing protein (c-di-GMP phosphodiesterase class II)
VLRVIVRQARPGMIIARTVINPRQPESILLTAGYKLVASDIGRLHELGVYDLWVEYPGLDFLDDLYSPQLTATQQRLCETLKYSFHEQARRSDSQLPILQYQDVVKDLVKSILETTATMPFMSALAGVDDALLRHSSEVCVLGVILGLRLEGYLIAQRKHLSGRWAKDVVNLGVGCMLHDIGELQLPEKQRETRRVSWDESPAWKKHVALGYSAVHGQIAPSAANLVLNHHQHFDGTGFPVIRSQGSPQCGAQIHVFARIAMAADTFQHVLMRDGINHPTVYALWQVQQAPYRGWFDPIVLAALLSVVPPFLPGMLVRLNDRRFAIVTKVHDDAPCYPQVQVLDGLDLMSRENTRGERDVIDLATTPELYIENVDGFDVSECLYGLRRAAPEPASQTAAHQTVSV